MYQQGLLYSMRASRMCIAALTRRMCSGSMGWSEPAATNAPVDDAAVEAVLRMNQKHILPCPEFLIFSASSLPQNFPSYLPPSHQPPPSYL